MKHLVLISDAWEPQINGVVTTLMQTVRILESRNWKVTVIHSGMFKSVPMPGYPEISLTLNPWKLKSQLCELKPTHVHIAVEGPLGITARFLLKDWGWDYTSAYHTNFPEYIKSHYGISPKLVIPLVKWFHQYSSAILVPSEGTANKLRSWGLSKSLAWGRGFDSSLFFPKPKKNDKLTLLYVGRVSEEKNIEDFLKLQTPERRLVVVGDGPARVKLEKQFPLAEFVGFKRGAELASFYQGADVFVFPSRTDTLGVVMIEAMACGTPVAAYNVEGPIDVVKDGISGALDPNDLESCVVRAANLDRALVVADSRRFSWEASCDTFESQLVPAEQVDNKSSK